MPFLVKVKEIGKAKTLAKNCLKQIEFIPTAVLVVNRGLDDLLFTFFFFFFFFSQL